MWDLEQTGSGRSNLPRNGKWAVAGVFSFMVFALSHGILCIIYDPVACTALFVYSPSVCTLNPDDD